jgi:hypothetical protein
VGTTVGAIAGPFRWGPANKPQLIDSELTLVATFGQPDNITASTWFTAANFLAYGNALQTVRVVKASGPESHMNATASGSNVLIENEDAYLANYAGGQGDVGMFAAKYPGDLGNAIAVSIADSGSFATWEYASNFSGAPNTSASVAASGGLNDEIHVVTVDVTGAWTGTPGQVLERFPYLSKSASAVSEDGSTMYYAEVLNRNSNYVWWMDHPTALDLGLPVTSPVTTPNWGGDNTVDYQTTSTQVTLDLSTVTNGPFANGEFVQEAAAVTVVSPGSGAAATAVATSSTALTITIGNPGIGYVVAPTVTATITGTGTLSGLSATISGGVVIAVNYTASGFTPNDTVVFNFTVPGAGATANITVDGSGRIQTVTPTNQGSGYTTPPNVLISGPGSGAEITAILGTQSLAGKVVSYTVINGGYGYTTVSGQVSGWDSGTGVLTITPTSGTFENGNVLVGTTSNAQGTVTLREGGYLYFELFGGVDGNASVSDGEFMTGYDTFKSGEDIDVSLILSGAADATLAQYLIGIAEYRQDCVVFISPPQTTVVDNAGNEATDIVTFRNLLSSSSYAFMDCNWKYQYDKYYDIYRWVPLNGDVAGLCVRTDTQRDPWWSPAGYNRGLIQNVVRLAWNPRKAYRDLLYQNGVNAVMSEPGQGTLLYGDKTLLSKPSAFDRINVRRLFIVLEKAISTAAKFTLFEFNDAFTQSQFVNMVEPYLADVQGRRGIYDYRVVCDSTNNTPDVVDSNSFVGDIYIKPARSINFIQLNFVAVRTGVDFSEIVGKF